MIEIEFEVPGSERWTGLYAPGNYTIGRGLGSDIRLRHPSIARRHAQLIVLGTSASMRDLGSADPIHRNGVVISTLAPACCGDVFRLGECRLRILRGTRSIEDTPVFHAAIEQTRPNDKPAQPLSARRDSEDAHRHLKQQVHALVLRELDLFRRTALNEMGTADLRKEARDAIDAVLLSGEVRIPGQLDLGAFARELAAEITGYGPIEPLLADDTISEVMVNGPQQIYVERAGRLQAVDERFISTDSLMRVIERIVGPVGRRIDEGAPMADARLPDGSRVNAIIPPLSLVGPVLTIRKFSRQRWSMQRLIEAGSLSAQMAEFLRCCVQHRKNIIVSGGTGSGKTTLLNSLSEYIDSGERIVTIEDAAELQLAQPHVIALEARPANAEGRGEIAIRDLVRNALRMRPDRIIVGECRGGEALDMLQAMNTGHDGSMTTGHANSPRDLLSRLEVMVLMAGMELPVRAIREQIASAIDIIVQQTRFSDGCRRVTAIVDVDGMEGDVILTQTLFEYRRQGMDAAGMVRGDFAGLGLAPRFYENLSEAGVRLDRSIFDAAPSPGARYA